MIKNIWFWIIQFCCWLFIAFIALSYSPLQDSDTNSQIIFFLTYLFVGTIIGYIYCFLVESIGPDDITTSQFIFYPFLGSVVIGFIFTIIDIFLGHFVFKNGFLDFFALLFKNSWIVIPCFFFWFFNSWSV